MLAQMLLGILFVAGKLASQIAVQQCVHPTSGTLRVFRRFARLGVVSVKMALSRPAHLRVTPTVGQFIKIKN
jgi:hypothetical protein